MKNQEYQDALNGYQKKIRKLESELEELAEESEYSYDWLQNFLDGIDFAEIEEEAMHMSMSLGKKDHSDEKDLTNDLTKAMYLLSQIDEAMNNLEEEEI